MKTIFSAIAGILNIAASVPYALAIIRGQTKPAKASWIIWAVLDTIILIGMIAKGVVNGQIIGVVCSVWIIAALALRHGIPGWTTLDKFCLSGAFLGIVLWQIFRDPIFGILTSLCVAFIGSIPTFVSAWEDPRRENRLSWTISGTSCIFAMIAVPRWTLADAAQPLTFAIVNSIMMYILYIHARNVRSPEELGADLEDLQIHIAELEDRTDKFARSAAQLDRVSFYGRMLHLKMMDDLAYHRAMIHSLRKGEERIKRKLGIADHQ